MSKSNKPKPNHPWKTTAQLIKTEVANWAKEKSTNAEVNNFKVGGGISQK